MVAFKFLSALAVFAGLAVAAPAADPKALEKRANIDITILQFALTLEHLENVFYKQALQNYTLADFQAAGYSADYYNNLKYIAYDEQTHVVLLQQAIRAAGAKPVKACTYQFPSTDVPSFITLSSILEDVGTSAYLGAAPLITSKQYLTVAGSILAVEAKHTSYERAAIGEVPFPNPLQTPLDGNAVFTLASAFIVSCPPSNYQLPFTAFPGLTYDGNVCTCEEPDCSSPSQYIKRGDYSPSSYPGGSYNGNPTYSCPPPSAGATVKFTAVNPIPAGSYVTFVNGLTVTSVQGATTGNDITAAIPAGIAGQTYVFVTKSDVETTFDDSQVLFGPAIVEVNPAPPQINYNILK